MSFDLFHTFFSLKILLLSLIVTLFLSFYLTSCNNNINAK